MSKEEILVVTDNIGDTLSIQIYDNKLCWIDVPTSSLCFQGSKELRKLAKYILENTEDD